MCGICGVLDPEGAAPRREVLEGMVASMRHRGPDDQGVWSGPGCGLAMARLSIIDLEGGHQPMSDETGRLQVVCNGEIYNFRELRHRLEGLGHRFATRSDTEVLLHGYQHWGDALVHHLDGMFGFALWDADRRRLLLARDRLGIKPLHYALLGRRLVFASEIKAILRWPGCPREVNLEALHAYLTYNYVPAPLTMYRGIFKLPPAHLLVWEQDALRMERYWDVPGPAQGRRLRDEEYLHGLLEVLSNSVRSHLVSDVPLGVLLSGGIDSSVITALMAAHLGSKVKTFSLGFSERSFSELGRARLVAEHFGTDHHEEVVTPDALNLAPRLLNYLDEPFADSSAIPTFLVARMARQEVTVVLSGEGGDEVFAGYETYAADRLAEYYRLLPAALRRWVIRPLAEHLPTSTGKVSLEYKAKRFVADAHLPPLERHHGWKVIFREEEKEQLYRPELARSMWGVAADPLEFGRVHYERTPAPDLLGSMQYVDTKVYLPDDILVKTDRMSMANSLEARVPLLDHHVVEYAAALPPDLRLRRLTKKYCLRRAFRGLLPPAILRGGKRGFSVPVSAWLMGEMREFMLDTLCPAVLNRQGFFRPEQVGAIIRDHLGRRRDLSRNLWGLLMFTLWHEHYLERRRDLPAAPVVRTPTPVK